MLPTEAFAVCLMLSRAQSLTNFYPYLCKVVIGNTLRKENGHRYCFAPKWTPIWQINALNVKKFRENFDAIGSTFTLDVFQKTDHKSCANP